jgi:hypothetical protein
VTSAIRETLNDWMINKTSLSLVVAGVGNVAAHTKSQYIDLATSGFGPLTYAGWIAVISCIWIITLLLDKWGFFHLVKWLWGKYRDRKTKA